jgi:hypothetical protein
VYHYKEEMKWLQFSGKIFNTLSDSTNGGLSSYIWKGKEQFLHPLFHILNVLLLIMISRGWKPNRNYVNGMKPFQAIRETIGQIR